MGTGSKPDVWKGFLNRSILNMSKICCQIAVKARNQRVEKVLHQAHQQREMHCILTIEEAEPLGIRKDHSFKKRTSTSRKRPQKEALMASVGNGRHPQPRFLSNRLRFCPAAIRKASMLTRQSSRKRKRRIPCQSLASAKRGSTQTCRLRMAFW